MNFDKLFTLAKEQGISDIEVYISSNRSASISLFNGEVDKNEMSDSKAFTVRGIYQGKMGYVTFEDETENLEKLVETLKENARVIDNNEEVFIYEGDHDYPVIESDFDNFFDIPTSEKIDLLKKITDETLQYDSRIASLPMCIYKENDSTVRIVNSKGLDISKRSAYAYAGGQVVAKDNEESKSAFNLDIANQFKKLDPSKISKVLGKKVCEKFGAKPCDSGKYPVIIQHEALGDLFASFTSMFSGEAAMNKVTSLIGKENKKIMGDNITIIDDPLYKDSLYSQPFDDEGVKCYTKEIVSDGVFKGFMHNLKTAKYFNTKATGNGFKQGTKIGVSGCNLYIKPGSKTLDEMIETIDKGLLITEVTGLHAGVNAISGDFSVQSSGFMIENGKKGEPVTLIVLSGNFLKAMNEVEMIGNDMIIDTEPIAAPSIKFKSLQVSGK